MNKNELKKLVKRASLQINKNDLAFFEKSFSVVLPMVTKLLDREVDKNTSAMERIITTPLKMSELSRVEHRLHIRILSREEIKKNSPLGSLGIVIGKKHG